MRAKNNGRYNGNGREWATPPEVFEPLHAQFNFTLDVCARAETARVPRFFGEPSPSLDAAYALAWDGLAQSWANERVWMNPPYGAEVYAWTRKARLEVAGGGCPLVVGLLPASTDLAWWHEDVLGCCAPGADARACRGLPEIQRPVADVVRWYRGRVRFLTGGPYRASGFFPSVAVAWRRRAR
jgi:hypothetical protein